MEAYVKGISVLLTDPAKTTPYKQVKVTGMSFSVDLRTLDVNILRFDPAAKQFIPLPNYPVSVRLLSSNQTESLITDASGYVGMGFPDSSIELQLSPAAVPASHQAVLTYPIKAAKRNALTVVFIPDSMRRYYPQLQLL